jgi:hypothetical protein
VPAATGVHLPRDDGSAHEMQLPLQALLQQTPWAQKPLAHSPAAAQVWPFCLGPQLPFVQACVASQSASVVQWLLQAPSTHRNGEQLCTPCGRQVPLPSQVPAVFKRAPVHDGAMQIVSGA